MKRSPKPQQKPTPKVINIAEYLRNKNILENTPYVFSKDVGHYLTDKGLVPEQEFISRYPLRLVPVNYKGVNPDHTKVS